MEKSSKPRHWLDTTLHVVHPQVQQVAGCTGQSLTATGDCYTRLGRQTLRLSTSSQSIIHPTDLVRENAPDLHSSEVQSQADLLVPTSKVPPAVTTDYRH